jgi:putative phosphoribosyl transferase
MVPDADVVIMVEAPARLSSVGQWYADFTQTSDETVVALLDSSRRQHE